MVDKDQLLEQLSYLFLTYVNMVGVDLNKCISNPHYEPLVQFVCGLGPRKGYNLLKVSNPH